MHTLSSSSLLEHMLRNTPRRYRLPALPALANMPAGSYSASTTLALVMEHARLALASDTDPDPALQAIFAQALAGLIREAMQTVDGDPLHQSVVLKAQAATVREYVALDATRQQDKRLILGLVNTLAHPAKLQRQAGGPLRNALTALHQAAVSEDWAQFPDIARQLQALAYGASDPAPAQTLKTLLDAPALQHLLRLQTLQTDLHVRQYLALLEQNGPRAGSAAATKQGADGKRRGNHVEALTTQALTAWAQRLNTAPDADAPYRVVSSMRVPGALTAGHERAKVEWDAVLLQQATENTDAPQSWEIRLLVEAKASVDAVATDLPRLLRGIRVLASADAAMHYAFTCREGLVSINGASLQTLRWDAGSLASIVLYCSDAPADTDPRLLSAAARAQLLSAPESLAFAVALAEARPTDPASLEPLWQQLLHGPQWKPVLHQYATLEQGRELMAHVEDCVS